MPSTILDFNAATIDRNVLDGVGGNYALGRVEGTTFLVQYIGRADMDLNARLKHLVNGTYTHFKFNYVHNVKQAYEKECRLYHALGGDGGTLRNQSHPEAPSGMPWTCPVCGK